MLRQQPVIHSFTAEWSVRLSWVCGFPQNGMQALTKAKAASLAPHGLSATTVRLHIASSSDRCQHLLCLLLHAGAFSPGVPVAFLANFEAANKFLGQLEALCPTKASLQVGSV